MSPGLYLGFNSRSPSGLRRPMATRQDGETDVSIHAAQAGCDTVKIPDSAHPDCFNSRSPSGLRHKVITNGNRLVAVSIHAAQAGCDLLGLFIRCTYLLFQFTQPKRAATYNAIEFAPDEVVSIHAAQAGCDLYGLVVITTSQVSIHAAQAGCDTTHYLRP